MSETDRRRPPSILIVDDETIVRQSLADWFRQDGYDVQTAQNGKEALRLLADRPADIAFVDIKMPGMDGLTLQGRLAEAQPDLTVIVMTAYASVESAVTALKAGAYDYITKPFDPEELSLLVRRAAEHRSLRTENQRLKEQLEAVVSPAPIVSRSAAMARVKEMIAAVAESDATVLVRGESGTGKELIARAIHARSARRYGPLVVVNCGALAEGVLESELFGHEKGAFTGAQHRHKGKFELADGGTIFLDEIGTVSPRMQVELLRVLEEKTVTRVGGQQPVALDFRVIAATNQDLDAMVKAGQLREDLYWRLHVFVIEIPRLAERREDVVPLAEHFVDHYARAMNRGPVKLSAAAREALESYDWPGNVRELQNAIERALVLGGSPEIQIEALPLRVLGTRTEGEHRSLAEVEKEHILRVLAECDWNISRSARVLEIDRGTLYDKINRYELKAPSASGRGG
ncbi:MAG: sigma-54 dependent transcriptional regulator [bacterium]